MRLVAWKTLRNFYQTRGNERAEQPLRTWKAMVESASWIIPTDVKATFPQTDILKSGRVVFDVGGNKWRIVGGIAYRPAIVFVKFVGTHRQYDDIDADTI